MVTDFIIQVNQGKFIDMNPLSRVISLTPVRDAASSFQLPKGVDKDTLLSRIKNLAVVSGKLVRTDNLELVAR